MYYIVLLRFNCILTSLSILENINPYELEAADYIKRALFSLVLMAIYSHSPTTHTKC